MGEKGNAHPLNPNICASCLSLLDELPKPSISDFPDFDDKRLVMVDFRPVTTEPTKASAHA